MASFGHCNRWPGVRSTNQMAELSMSHSLWYKLSFLTKLLFIDFFWFHWIEKPSSHGRVRNILSLPLLKLL